MAHWRVQVLGHAQVTRDGETSVPERRTAAILAFLALEGPTPRSRLAGLLWPEVPEATARNNLAQALRRSRRRLGAAIVTGDDPLRLDEAAEVDVAAFRNGAFPCGQDEVPRAPGALLGDASYDDLPDFAEWLEDRREDLATRWRQTLQDAIDRHEAAGRFGAAARCADRWARAEPLAEAPYRRLMRALYLAGDRPAALAAYHRCQQALRAELGVEPMPETVDLARAIERGEVPGPAAPTIGRALPISILRPPVLVGRDEAWSRMERAWSEGRFLVLAGEAGVGKTRLALDFAASKGAYLTLEGRPGDRGVPLATTLRNVRSVLAHRPDLPLEPWQRRALARLAPELGEPDGDDVATEARLHQALLKLLRAELAIETFVYDDLHFADDASIDAGFFVLSSSFPMGRPGEVTRWIACVRDSELADHVRDVLRRGVAVGHAEWIDLEPLDEPATRALLDSLALAQGRAGLPPGLAATLHRRTGGNALFLLETLRDLIETERLGDAPPEPLPLPDRVASIVRQRLARLSPAAQRVAQTAAVLRSDFDLDLIGRVLDADPPSLIDAWEELARAQLVRGPRFSHDLLLDAVLASVTGPVRTLLERRAAEVLEAGGAQPARVAQHRRAVEGA
jgi:DNA-binding SARP family transcriptional activator